MPRLFFSLLLLTLCSQAQAAPQIRDFAFQAAISESDQKLQRIELPLEVILASTSPSIGDLAVFNADGKQMPHAVAVTPDAVVERELELPFHKFDRFLQQQPRTVTTREQNQQQNSISELETTETIAVQSVRNDYLIEIAPDDNDRGFDRLELQWKHEPAGQILEVKIEIGNELDRMRTIQPRKSLTNSESGDPDWRSIRQVPANNKYLRLTPLTDAVSFELLRVTGHYRETLPAPVLIHSIVPELVADETDKFYFFEYPSMVTAATMRIIPGDNHSIIVGDLYASSRSDPDNRRLVEANFHQHNIDNAELQPSRPFNIRRLRPANIWFSSRETLPSPPRVELGYPQYEVVFLGDGNGPYRLAWGSHASQAAGANLSELLEGSLRDMQQRGARVQLGPTEEAGGISRLSPESTLPWQQWLLWALLLLAAIVTGRMAYRLYGEMNAGDRP